jgi:hypothetical protein
MSDGRRGGGNTGKPTRYILYGLTLISHSWSLHWFYLYSRLDQVTDSALTLAFGCSGKSSNLHIKVIKRWRVNK